MFNAFENRVLRRIIVTQRTEVVGHWEKILIEENQNLNSTSYYVKRIMKWRRVVWANK
jgi:hypothetical protein